jgi:hypothetical protein
MNDVYDWRWIEGALIAQVRSHGGHVTDVGGEPLVELVRFREADEVATVKLSLEKLAQLLARVAWQSWGWTFSPSRCAGVNIDRRCSTGASAAKWG